MTDYSANIDRVPPARLKMMTAQQLSHRHTILHLALDPIALEIAKVEIELESRHAPDCPDCKKGKLLSAPGGGIRCTDAECGYWFCY